MFPGCFVHVACTGGTTLKRFDGVRVPLMSLNPYPAFPDQIS